MSYLVADPEDRFSSDETQLVFCLRVSTTLNVNGFSSSALIGLSGRKTFR